MTHIKQLHYCFQILVFLDRYVSVELLWWIVHATAYLVSAFLWKTITQIPPLSEWLCQFEHQRNNFAIDFEIVRSTSFKICHLLIPYVLRKFARLYRNDSLIYMATINLLLELKVCCLDTATLMSTVKPNSIYLHIK